MAITATISSRTASNVTVTLDGKSSVGTVSIPGPKGDAGTIATADNITLESLSNVNASSLGDGSMLMYSSGTSKWVSKTDLTPESGDLVLSGGNF
jgi:hypothetical protein